MRSALVVSLLVGCGSGEAVVILGAEAREAGVTIDRGSGPEARALPLRVEADWPLRVVADGRERELELAVGEIALVTAELESEPVEGEALLVHGEEEAVARLAASLDATMAAHDEASFVLTGEALTERAADLDDIEGVRDVRPTTLAALARPAERPRARFSFDGPRAVTAAPAMAVPAALQSAPRLQRWVEYFSYCGSRLPAMGRRWSATHEGVRLAEGVTDHLGLIVIDHVPAADFTLQVDGGVPVPRPYDFAVNRMETHANVGPALASEDLDTLLYGLEDAAKLARPEWAEAVAARLSDPRPGVWIVAAAALGSYDAEFAERAAARAPAERRVHVLHAAGIAPMSLPVDAVFVR